MAVSGDTAVIGARVGDRGIDSGSAYVFTRSGATWTQQAKLTASDGASYAWFGYSVAISGDTAVISAPWDDEKGDFSYSGSAYFFGGLPAPALMTPEDTPLVVAAPGVLANDTDADGDSLTAELVAGPAHGSVTLSEGGSFTYTPLADWSGTGSFTYRASDGTADSNVAVVSITVTPVNDAPVAQAQSVVTDEDTMKAVTLVATDVEGDPLTYTVVTGGVALIV